MENIPARFLGIALRFRLGVDGSSSVSASPPSSSSSIFFRFPFFLLETLLSFFSSGFSSWTPVRSISLDSADVEAATLAEEESVDDMEVVEDMEGTEELEEELDEEALVAVTTIVGVRGRIFPGIGAPGGPYHMSSLSLFHMVMGT